VPGATTAGVSGEDTGEITRRIHGSGLDLALTEQGVRHAPTVLLVHGFPDTSAAWSPVAQALAPEFHVVRYDVRGAGGSDVPVREEDYALPLLIADMAAVIDAVSPDFPVHLVAHDWGSIQGWEAVTSELLAGRIASFTSISGPPLDHAALWARQHRAGSPAERLLARRQARRSWYIIVFHLPGLPELVRGGLWISARLSARRRRNPPRGESAPVSTRGSDFAHGLYLYRANVRQRFRRPTKGHTETPVQIIVPLGDPYVTPALLEGLETWSPLVWRRQVDAGHWVIRTHPDDVAAWIRQVIGFVEGGPEPDDLARWRVPSSEATPR
jgi:pimeloyl-ACP methyl ester carboxylesterase